MIPLRTAVPASILVAGLAACSPVRDWRDVRPEGTDLTAVFPCRPAHHARRISLAGATGAMQMYACEAGDVTYALSFFDVDSPAQIGPALAQLRALAVGNIAAARSQTQALQVPGMTPNAESVGVRAVGRLPDARPVQLEAALFSKGLRVYQASAIGAALPEAATQPFFSGLKLSQ